MPNADTVTLNDDPLKRTALPEAYIKACEKNHCTRPTYLQIAEMAGVSESTVQRKMNDASVIVKIREELQKKNEFS